MLAEARTALEDGSLDDPEAQRRLVDLDLDLTYTFMTWPPTWPPAGCSRETLGVDW